MKIISLEFNKDNLFRSIQYLVRIVLVKKITMMKENQK